MIDIHAHYVPAVDDGSWDGSMTRCMMLFELQQGGERFFATPHSYAFDEDADEVRRSFEELKLYLEPYRMDDLVYLGCEVACEPHKMEQVLENLKTGKYPSMNGTHYVLTEFSAFVVSEEALSVAGTLVQDGWIPILAHIERYPKLFDGETIDLLLELGCLLQVNAYSFQEESKETIRSNARQLLAEQKISFLGSDAHRLHQRPPSVASGIEYVKQHCGNTYAEALLSGNAKKLLLGEILYGK